MERHVVMREAQAIVAPRGSSRRIAELIANFAFGKFTDALPLKPLAPVAVAKVAAL
jgi:hypothetical protein